MDNILRPRLRFAPYHDFYIITIENLNALAVAQIQQLETFATQRRSRLDFHRGTIQIWKRIDFEHFNRTLVHAGILAQTFEGEASITPSQPYTESKVAPVTAKIGFGKHRGLAYRELPEGYLMWLKGNYQGRERPLIEAELQARNL